MQTPWGSGRTLCLRNVKKASETGAEEMKQKQRRRWAWRQRGQNPRAKPATVRDVISPFISLTGTCPEPGGEPELGGHSLSTG